MASKRKTSTIKAVVFDTETTGLLKHPKAKDELQPRIIEFGAVLIDGRGKELDHYCELIDPEELITDEITSITGITNEQLQGKPTFRKVLPDIKKIFGKASIMIAHNLPFDEGVLVRELGLLGSPEFPWPPMKMCTAQESVHEYGRRMKLKDLYKDTIGEAWVQKHRALDDCRRLAEIVVAKRYLEAFI